MFWETRLPRVLEHFSLPTRCTYVNHPMRTSSWLCELLNWNHGSFDVFHSSCICCSWARGLLVCSPIPCSLNAQVHTQAPWDDSPSAYQRTPSDSDLHQSTGLECGRSASFTTGRYRTVVEREGIMQQMLGPSESKPVNVWDLLGTSSSGHLNPREDTLPEGPEERVSLSESAPSGSSSYLPRSTARVPSNPDSMPAHNDGRRSTLS